MLLESARFIDPVERFDAATTLVEFSKKAWNDRLQEIIDEVYFEYVRYGRVLKRSAGETEPDNGFTSINKTNVRPSDESKKTKRSAAEAELDNGFNPINKTNVRPPTIRRTETVKSVQNEPKSTATANTDKAKRTKAPCHSRTKNTKGRSTIELYGNALSAVIRKHDKELPNYSASFSDPRESEIVQKVFAKAGTTAGNKEREKYEGVKRRCLFAAALLYEGNLLRIERGDKPFDINTTRMQPAGLIDVNCIRPVFRAYRPDNDTTFKAKANKEGNDPDEAIKGLLADREWLPKMVEKKSTGFELVNTDWYENLGDKEERKKWLTIVEEKKVQLIEETKLAKAKAKEAKAEAQVASCAQ